MFVVTVNFVIKQEFFEDFRKMIIDNAEASKRVEPGCKYFDVCYGTEIRNSIFLYEIYSCENDFNMHLESEHFQTFNSKTQHMVIDKKINTFHEVR